MGFSIGAENAALKPITDMLTEINAADTYKPLTTFNLADLIAPAIGDGMTYATYPGASPPRPAMRWSPGSTSRKPSQSLLLSFKHSGNWDGKGGMIVNNYRSPQPTASRVPKLYN